MSAADSAAAATTATPVMSYCESRVGLRLPAAAAAFAMMVVQLGLPSAGGRHAASCRKPSPGGVSQRLSVATATWLLGIYTLYEPRWSREQEVGAEAHRGELRVAGTLDAPLDALDMAAAAHVAVGPGTSHTSKSWHLRLPVRQRREWRPAWCAARTCHRREWARLNCILKQHDNQGPTQRDTQAQGAEACARYVMEKQRQTRP